MIKRNKKTRLVAHKTSNQSKFKNRRRQLRVESLEARRLLAANLSPENDVPSSATTQVNTPVAFTAYRDNLISTSDPDAGLNQVAVTLAANRGTITLLDPDPNGGLTYSVGDGFEDTTMTFTAKLTDVNTALSWISFQPEADYVGSEASLTITTNDQGHLGTGGPQEDTDVIPIEVTAVPAFDDPPSWTTFPGALDSSFGDGGILEVSLSSGTDYIRDLEVLESGKILAVGAVNNHYGLIRYNADLTIDSAFGESGVVETNVGSGKHATALTIDKLGRLIVVGDEHVVRYDADGKLDQTFGSGGIVQNTYVGQIYDVDIEADGKIAVIGRDVYGMRVSRYNVDGSGAGGGIYSGTTNGDGKYGRGIFAKDNGEILLFGRDYYSPSFAVVTIDSAGVKKSHTHITFPDDNGSPNEHEFVHKAARLPDNKFLVIGSAGGDHTMYAGVNTTYNAIAPRDIAITRHNYDGSLDTSFGVNGRLRLDIASHSDEALNVTLQRDGKLLISGHTWNGQTWDFSIVRTTYDGQLDTTFSNDGKLTIPSAGKNSHAYAAAVLDDNRILVAGRANNEIGMAVLLGDSDVNGEANASPTIDAISDISVDEDISEQTINLSGITAGADDDQTLSVTATSSNSVLIPEVAVLYTSAQTTGTLKFTPASDQFGSSTITVTVEDAGKDGDLNTAGDNATFSRTFEVVVNPINDAPTLGLLDNITIEEDAPEQTISLTDIGAGGGESQSLQVIASSDNPALIPNPSVNYSSPDATGSLTFTPTGAEDGSATITVTVVDAGLDNNLAASGDNGVTSQTFVVTVTDNDVLTITLESGRDHDVQLSQLDGKLIMQDHVTSQTLLDIPLAQVPELVEIHGAPGNSNKIELFELSPAAAGTGAIPRHYMVTGGSTGNDEVVIVGSGSQWGWLSSDSELDLDLKVEIKDLTTLLDTFTVQSAETIKLNQLERIEYADPYFEVANQAFEFNTSQPVTLPAQTSLVAGTISSTTPVVLRAGASLIGDGFVHAEVAGRIGSLIQATGDLVMGDSNSSIGFETNGQLVTGQHTVTLRDSNQASVGALTTLGSGEAPGILLAPNGLILNFDGNIEGYGQVDTTKDGTTSPLLNNGSISGTSSDKPITLTATVNGVGSFDNVVMDGTYTPGFSPALTSNGAVVYSDRNTIEIELGGYLPGSQHDRIEHTSAELGGKLVISLIDGYIPRPGAILEVIQSTTDFTGAFDSIELPEAVEGRRVEAILESNRILLETVFDSTQELHVMSSSETNFEVKDWNGLAMKIRGNKFRAKVLPHYGFRSQDAWVNDGHFMRGETLIQSTTDGVNRIDIAGSRWKNFVSPHDINNDGNTSALDALTIINELARGSFVNLDTNQLPPPSELSEWPGIYYDTNGDDRATVLDALLVLNELARTSNSSGEGEFTDVAIEEWSRDLTPISTANQTSEQLTQAPSFPSRIFTSSPEAASYVSRPQVVDAEYESMGSDSLKNLDESLLSLLAE